MTVSGDEYLSSVIVAFLLAAALGYGGVFFLQGLIFALYFREGRRTGILSDVYATDLAASGAGALAGGALVFVLTPVQMVMVASVLLLANLWLSFRYLGIPLLAAVGVSAALVTMLGVEWSAGPVAGAESLRWRHESGFSFVTWSPYRRIDVVERPNDLWVYTDGLPFQTYQKGETDYQFEPRAIPLRMIPPGEGGDRSVLVIGAGTGSDVRIARALHGDSLDVVAVEIDGGFIRTSEAIPWLWEDFRTAEIVVQEGRHFLESDDDQYDMVLYAYVDPQSAISRIGLPDANFLYTDAGIRSAYERVKEGGLLAITRVYFVEREEPFVQRLCATLQAAGIPLGEISLYRHRQSIRWGYYGHLGTVHAFANKGGVPPVPEHPNLVPLECTGGGRPTTDVYPFSLVTRVWFGTLARYVKGQPIALLLLITFAVTLGYRLSTSVGHLNFFLMGFGSFLVESLVLFNSFLLLGNPSLSAAVAVGCFLLWNAVGSRYSDRLQQARWFYVATPLLVLLYGATALYLNALTIALPIWLRTIAFAVHLSIAGVAVGAMFPVSLRIFKSERVPSMFFIDLIGCAVAPLGFWLAMSWLGLSAVVGLAVASYAAVCGILLYRLR
jgi:hypothetical protein